MLSQKTKTRIFFLVFLFFILISGLYFFLKSLEENIVYFLSPYEISKSELNVNKKIRIGGMVKKDSLVTTSESINFIITDYKKEIFVSYSGSIPNLFSEGKGIVAEGKLIDKNYFVADKILAKHDENYMPPEVSAILNEKEK